MQKRNLTWLDLVKHLRSENLTDKEIYEGLGMSSGQFRARMTMERAAYKQERIMTVRKMKYEHQYSNMEISRRTGIPEPTVRSLLKDDASEKADALLGTAKMLKDEVDRKQWVDVGSGVETHLGISQERLTAAVEILKQQGYLVHPVRVLQVGTGNETPYKVLAQPGTTQKDAWSNRENIQQLDRFSVDGGKTYAKVHDPIAINPNRLAVRWGEDGGGLADGVIYVRPGAKDLDMGGNHYAQVRIQVGPDKYLKGMAVLKDDLPAGVDLLFNTPKLRSVDGPDKLNALKDIKKDSDLPFGSVIRRQVVANPGTDKERNISAVNLVNEAGAWAEWSKTIASQVLSKQSPALARDQLAITYARQQREFDEIMALTNPVVKKKLLESFAKATDTKAVHLKAASTHKDAAYHVILPVENMKPTEVFAPKYPNGTRVALIRYPHGGPFEIPDLIVNNGHRGARASIGLDSIDAIGIHPSVAERLSGADFDGDSVMVIPNNSGKIKSQPALSKLKGFDPKAIYKLPDDAPGIRDMKDPGGMTQRIMGEASNLITDMTVRGASPDKLARAVAFSMVTIDAEKHHLDYKKAKKDFAIDALKDEFQVDSKNPDSRGASTLISRAGSKVYIPDRKLRLASDGGPIDKETGALVYVPSGKTKKNRNGEVEPKMIKAKRLELTDDAHTLSSGTPIERIYADHSNRLKGLANKARLEAYKTPPMRKSSAAEKIYADEVSALKSGIQRAKMNAPRERQAQVIANANIRMKRQENPGMEKDRIKKMEYAELARARKRTGAGKELIKITPKQWEAIQAGAISTSMLKDVLANADLDIVKKLATPKKQLLMSDSDTAKAAALLASGKYTRAQVAARMGVSVSTLDRAVGG